MADLDTENTSTQERLAQYLLELLGVGFSGFRIGSAKYIEPKSIAQILGKLKKKLGGTLTNDFMAYLDKVIDGDQDLLFCKNSTYNFGEQLFERTRIFSR